MNDPKDVGVPDATPVLTSLTTAMILTTEMTMTRGMTMTGGMRITSAMTRRRRRSSRAYEEHNGDVYDMGDEDIDGAGEEKGMK